MKGEFQLIFSSLKIQGEKKEEEEREKYKDSKIFCGKDLL